MSLGFAGDVESRRQQMLVIAEALDDSVGIAGRGDHRIAGIRARFRDQSAKSPGCSVMNQTRMMLPFPLVPGGFAEADGQGIAARHN